MNGGVNNGTAAPPVNPNQASSASGTLGTPPNTGSQFGSNGVNGGVNNGTTATPVNPNQASSASGTLGTPANTGSQFGAVTGPNGVNNTANPVPNSPTATGGAFGTGTGVVGNNPNVATHFGPNGEVFRGDSSERAALNRNRAFRFFQGRWWYPLAGNQWMYWNGANWVNYPASVTPGIASTGGTVPNVAGGNVSGQYSSGYRGVPTSPINNNEMNARVDANVNTNVNASSGTIGWYWRDGNWLWFNGQTFTAAR